MTVLTRYLLRAHLGPFVFAFVALTGVILINTLAKELANLAGKGLPIPVVIEFFVLSLPANIALTLPMSVLVAVLYTFSTLAAENEITALRASGIDLRRVALPLIVGAALIAGTMVWFNDRVLPAANYRWRMLMTDVAQTRPLLGLREQAINPIPTSDGQVPYYLEAQEIDAASGYMRNIAIYDVSNEQVGRTINADSGRIAYDASRTDLLLTLYDGEAREVDFGELTGFQIVDFQRQVMRMKGVADRLERSDESGYRTDRDMTLGMMHVRIDSLRIELDGLLAESRGEPRPSPAVGASPNDDPAAAGDAVPAARAPGSLGLPSQDTGATQAAVGGQIPAVAAPLPPSMGALPVSEETMRFAAERARNVEYQIREYQVEIQKKYSIAAATLVFVLIGIPIALRFPRGGIGMVIAVSLTIFGIYYVGLIGGETLGNEGYVLPTSAMWLTNGVFGALGLWGFLRLGREQGTGRGGEWRIVRGVLALFARRGASADP